jgi:hypothetical protein
METEIRRPEWEMFRKLVDGCRGRLLVCSPWISVEGVEKLNEFVSANGHIRSIEIWTRLAEVATDSSGLLRFAQTLTSRGVCVTIRDSPILHAKVFLADKTSALLGSANLTGPGFSRNPEIIVLTSEPPLLNQIITVLEGFVMQPVRLEELERFVSEQLPVLQVEDKARVISKITPIWRRNHYPRTPLQVVHSRGGRRAFLLGSDPSSGNVQEIVKMALWGKRSINIYNLLSGSRDKIYPASDAVVQDYTDRGFEIDEPYMREELTQQWIDYGRKKAAEKGFNVAP